MPAPLIVVTGPSGVGKSTVSRLVAGAFDPSAHVRMDDVMGFVVNGWVEPWLPEAAHQNEVLGGAAAIASMHLAEHGYTVVLDGHLFPEGLEHLAQVCRDRSLPLHYAVLRAAHDTCLARAVQRDGAPPDATLFTDLHARHGDLGAHEANVVDAGGSPDEVAAAVLAAVRAGTLAPRFGPGVGDP